MPGLVSLGVKTRARKQWHNLVACQTGRTGRLNKNILLSDEHKIDAILHVGVGGISTDVDVLGTNELPEDGEAQDVRWSLPHLFWQRLG